MRCVDCDHEFLKNKESIYPNETERAMKVGYSSWYMLIVLSDPRTDLLFAVLSKDRGDTE